MIFWVICNAIVAFVDHAFSRFWGKYLFCKAKTPKWVAKPSHNNGDDVKLDAMMMWDTKASAIIESFLPIRLWSCETSTQHSSQLLAIWLEHLVAFCVLHESVIMCGTLILFVTMGGIPWQWAMTFSWANFQAYEKA